MTARFSFHTTLAGWLTSAMIAGFAAFGMTASANPDDAANKSDTSAPAGPAMWRVKDADTEIILFGTIHLLPADLEWQRAELKAAVSSAKYLYLEVDGNNIDPADQAAFNQASFAKQGEFLSDLLTVEDQNALVGHLQSLNLNPQVFNQRMPWFVSLLVGQMLIEQNGYTAEHGAEAWLTQQALLHDTPVRALETLSDVAIPMSQLPNEDQVAMLQSTLAEVESSQAVFDASTNAWMAGDTVKVDELMMKEMRDESPSVYKVVLEDRNRKWLATVESLLNTEEGKIVIAVGTGHLIGPVSLVQMLEDKGWTVERF